MMGLLRSGCRPIAGFQGQHLISQGRESKAVFDFLMRNLQRSRGGDLVLEMSPGCFSVGAVPSHDFPQFTAIINVQEIGGDVST
jgi:hypothetical protein